MRVRSEGNEKENNKSRNTGHAGNIRNDAIDDKINPADLKTCLIRNNVKPGPYIKNNLIYYKNACNY